MKLTHRGVIYIPHKSMDVITFPRPNPSWSLLVNGHKVSMNFNYAYTVLHSAVSEKDDRIITSHRPVGSSISWYPRKYIWFWKLRAITKNYEFITIALSFVIHYSYDNLIVSKNGWAQNEYSGHPQGYTNKQFSGCLAILIVLGTPGVVTNLKFSLMISKTVLLQTGRCKVSIFVQASTC